MNTIDDGLTDEERAALAEDDGGTGGGEGGNDEGINDNGINDNGGSDDELGTGEQAGVAVAAAGTAAAAAADAAAGADAGAGDTKQPGGQEVQGAPILIANVPADIEAKLGELTTQKDALVASFDDGDITAREYQKQLDVLNRQERELENVVNEARLAEKIETQRQANDWKSTVDSFIGENPRYDPKTNASMYKMLDLEVRNVAVTDEFKGRGDAAAGREILKRAHANLAKSLGFDAGASEPKPKEAKPGAKPAAIPSLDKLPAAGHIETGDSKYLGLDRLLSSDPIAYEEALMALSESERNKYLSA